MDEHVTSIIQPNIESDTDDSTLLAHFQLPGNWIFSLSGATTKISTKYTVEYVSNVKWHTYMWQAHTQLFKQPSKVKDRAREVTVS